MSVTPDSTEQYRYFLRGLEIDRADLVPAGANPGAHITLFKHERDSTSPVPNQEAPVMDPKEQAPAPELVAKADLDAAMQEIKDAKAEAEALQKQLADAQDARVEAEQVRKELEDQRAEIAKMRQEAREREFIAKADEFKTLGPVTEIAKVLMDVDDHCSDETKQTVQRILSGAAAQVEKGDLFSAFARTDPADDGSWEDQLLAKAKDLVEKGDAPTIEIAQQKVMQSDADLRRSYQQSIGRA